MIWTIYLAGGIVVFASEVSLVRNEGVLWLRAEPYEVAEGLGPFMINPSQVLFYRTMSEDAVKKEMERLRGDNKIVVPRGPRVN